MKPVVNENLACSTSSEPSVAPQYASPTALNFQTNVRSEFHDHLSQHLNALEIADRRINDALQAHESVLSGLLEGKVELTTLPLKHAYQFLRAKQLTQGEALLLLDISRNQRQQDLSHRLGMKTEQMRSKIYHNAMSLAEELKTPLTKSFVREVKQRQESIRTYRWALSFDAWLRAGGDLTLLPSPLTQLPFCFLKKLPEGYPRISVMINNRLRQLRGGRNKIDIFAIRYGPFLGFDVSSQGNTIGRYAVAVVDPKSGRVNRLTKEPDSLDAENLPQEIWRAKRCAGEFTRMVAGIGPFEIEMAMGLNGFKRHLADGSETRIVSLFADVTKKRPAHLSIPRQAVRDGVEAVRIEIPPSSVSHLVSKGSLIGAEVLINGIKNGDLAVPIVKLRILTFNKTRIKFKSVPTGDYLNSKSHGGRVALGHQILQQLINGTGGEASGRFSVVGAGGIKRAPRVQVAGRVITLPKNFRSAEVEIKILETPRSARVMAFFEIADGVGRELQDAACLVSYNRRNKRLEKIKV